MKVKIEMESNFFLPQGQLNPGGDEIVRDWYSECNN